jgi:hypothetical protein
MRLPTARLVRIPHRTPTDLRLRLEDRCAMSFKHMAERSLRLVKYLERTLGFARDPNAFAARRGYLQRCINLQLMSMGLGGTSARADAGVMEVAGGLLASYRQKSRLLEAYRCPADRRIESFLQHHLSDLKPSFSPRLPGQTLVLEQHGVARELSLPQTGDAYESPLVKSYRLGNGVLHNPRADRRTTQGTFHIAEGGLAIADDKVAVAKEVFARMFDKAVNPPHSLMVLPYTAQQARPAEVFCSLLLRPLVCPEIPGVSQRKTMEIRFFAPGSLVSNLDFVESIFGNAGDPMLPDNDAGLDVLHWTGHTGCVILAPHLCELIKKELGLPHYDAATSRQRRDRQCWKDAGEKYNDGQAFKLTCRTEAGVIVTLIADNYFGYCKKEVKTQISYAANLYGNAEEEHSGGAVVFPSYNLGDEYIPNARYSNGRTFGQLVKEYGEWMHVHAEGYGVDRQYANVIYIPEDATLTLRTQIISWNKDGATRTLPLLINHYYMTPWGSKIYVDKHPSSGRFRLIVTIGEGTFCHKPCTVSGGGKSEISKSLHDYMIYGPVYVGDLQKDLDEAEKIFKKDHGTRWKAGKEPQDYQAKPSRPILGDQRSLGSVIKLLTPSPDYNDAYLQWLESIPSAIFSLVFLIKRLYKPQWGSDWRSHLTVDVVNGEAGHELKVDDKPAGGSYLRVGLLANQTWKNFRLRQDFYPAMKVQMEDDISASTVAPPGWLKDLAIPMDGQSLKLAQNCEYRLFQRPDDAIHPGFDKQAEQDIARSDNFLSNYQPLTARDASGIVERITEFDRYTPPMKNLLLDASKQQEGYIVCSAYPRLVDGKPSKNPRYLQTLPELVNPLNKHLAQMGLRLSRGIAANKPVITPVNSVLFGRRNNPPDRAAGIRSLAVFNPIHYQELPELFMDFICSLTGKSPSTTGAGSEGALTKGPFNALIPIIDLNTALVSYVLTGLAGFSTAAGYIGPSGRVDHDLSLMIPELWCRMRPHQRDPNYLIQRGHLEKLNDFEHEGKKIPASRLGYRITYNFVRTFFGRVFANPNRVLEQAMLKPELQDADAFADGILNIAEAQQRVAQQYFDDGSIRQACPPLQALLHVMVHGHFEGKTVHDASVRRMFTRDYLLESDWYAARLRTKQSRDIALWKRHASYLADFVEDQKSLDDVDRLNLRDRLAAAKREVEKVSSTAYLETLTGTLGADSLAG